MAKKKTRKKSRITTPNDGSSKHPKMSAFRVDKDIAGQLDKAPNKSETINDALRMYFGRWETCKKCNGTGLVRKNRKLKK